MPPGSTSNHFRTRDALLAGVSDAIVQREMAGARPAFAPRSTEEFLDGLIALFDRTTRDQRILTPARLVLFLKASHDPALRDALWRGRAIIAAALVLALQGLGARDSQTAAGATMACAEGLFLDPIARHDDTDVWPIFDLVLRAAVA